MSEFDSVSYLASKGYHPRLVSGGAEALYPCFLGCGEPADSRKRKLYVSVAEGWSNCKVCGFSGGSYLLQAHFGDDPKATKISAGYEELALKRQCLEDAVATAHDMLVNNDEVLDYLMEKRGLSVDTILDRRLGYVGKDWSLIGCLKGTYTDEILKAAGLSKNGRQDYFHRHLLIPYLHHGNVTQIRGRTWPDAPGPKYLTPAGFPAELYGRDGLVGTDDVIICEGEMDAITVYQALQASPEVRLRAIAVVASPGVETLKKDWSPLFEDAKRIYLCFDPDEAGKRGAERAKELFDTRARILQLPEELPKADANAWLLPIPDGASPAWRKEHPHAGHDWRDLQQLISDGSGRRLFTIAESGASWRRYKTEHPQGLKTGFRVLDSAIEPGLLPGQVLIILAKTGAGKTILLCNLIINMLNRRVLLLTLEMTREEIYERLRRIYLFWYPLASDDTIDYALGNIMICDENRVSDTQLRQLIDEYAMEKGLKPEVLAVDFLGYFARGQKGGSLYEKTTNAAMQLKAEAKAHRIVVISPAQVNRTVDQGRPIDLEGARESGTIEETADFLVSIYRPDDAAQSDTAVSGGPTAKVRMQILKSRHGNVGAPIGLQMDMLSLAIVDDGTPAARRAAEHNRMHWRGDSWEDMRRKELAPVQGELS